MVTQHLIYQNCKVASTTFPTTDPQDTMFQLMAEEGQLGERATEKKLLNCHVKVAGIQKKYEPKYIQLLC